MSRKSVRSRIQRLKGEITSLEKILVYHKQIPGIDSYIKKNLKKLRQECECLEKGEA